MNFLSRLWHRLRGEQGTAISSPVTAAPAVNPDPVFLATRGDTLKERFIVLRQAVLDRDMAVTGYDFTQIGDLVASQYAVERDKALLQHVRGQEARKLVAGRTGFVSIVHTLLFDHRIDELAGTKTIPLLRPASLHDIDELHTNRIEALKLAGIEVGLADGRAALENDALAGAIRVAFFSITEFLPPDLLQISRRLAQQHPALRLGIRGIESQEEFDACRRMNFVYFHGPFIRRREEWSQNRADPGAVRICDLLGRLRKGAELEQIAEQIKLDPMISYRILRLANSAAVGATRDITSIRDATLILGRDPLYRWLVLLLCLTAPVAPGQQALLEYALTRGRLMELLAPAGTKTAARQVLFLTGMFSLLDVMLKVPMQSLLSQLSLPPQVSDAIVGRIGPCALALQLAEACEQADGPRVTGLCAELGIDIATLNQRQAEAGAWARASAHGVPA